MDITLYLAYQDLFQPVYQLCQSHQSSLPHEKKMWVSCTVMLAKKKKAQGL